MKIPITIDKGLVRFVRSEILREVGWVYFHISLQQKKKFEQKVFFM